MLDFLRQHINDKNVLILGFGREGKSTYQIISSVGGYRSLAIADIAEIDFQFDEPVRTICGEDYQKFLDDFDIVFKSPGVVLKKDVKELKCEITSQTEEFIKVYRKQIVGITGTKGKSTTASLLYHVLEQSGRPCVLMGNIGVPALDILPSLTENTIIVNELSSHQLEYTDVSPHIAVLLNIYQEHLDHYGSYEKYIQAKKNIYLHQKKGDILICNSNILPDDGECSATIFSASVENADISTDGDSVRFEKHKITIPAGSIKLIGRHNYYNIAVAYAICKLLDIPDGAFLNSLISYQPLPHRMEFIGEIDGVKYYDDSISTVCETTIQAITSLPDIDTVLIGGMDRGIDYGPLIEFLSVHQIPHIILMYETGKRIYLEIAQTHPKLLERTILAESLKEAISLAKALTVKGGTCLMSPAAASYGLFKNFEERGNIFKKYVLTNGKCD